MLNKFQESRDQYLRQKYQDLEVANWEYRSKDIYDRFHQKVFWAKKIVFIPTILSIFLAYKGYYYFLSILNNNTVLAFLGSVLFVILLELLKGIAIKESVWEYLENKKFNWAIIAFIPIILSIFSSTIGAKIIWEQEQNLTTEIANTKKLAIDSLLLYYDQQTKIPLETINSVNESRKKSPNGWVSKYSLQAEKDAQEQVNILYREKSKTLSQINTSFQQQENTTLSIIEIATYAIMSLSIFLEWCILMFHGFIAWYGFRIKNDICEQHSSNNPSISLSTIQATIEKTVWKELNHPTQTSTIQNLSTSKTLKKVKTQEAIGFNTKQRQKSGAIINNSFLEKYADVVACIDRGYSERETINQCDISRSTYYNVKRAVKLIVNH